MRKYRVKIMAWLMAILLSATIYPLNIHANSSSIDGLSAESALLYAYDLGEVLYEKDAHRRMPIASTTKIMTALAVLSSKNLDEVVTVPSEACGIEGSSIYLVEGEKLTIKELLQALMLQSANDAAVALAIATDGSIEAFAERMNGLAEEMGLQNTHFANPHGLDHPEHYSSAYDLAIIAAKAFENPEFRRLTESKTAKIPGRDGGVRVLTNHNKLLRMFDGAIGVKTGFTKKSGRCLVGAAERDGITLISVTLNAPNDWQDHQTMLTHGFSLLENKRIAKKGELLYEAPIVGGIKDQIHLTNSDDVTAILKNDQTEIETKAEWNRPIFAPVKQGEVMGRLYFMQNGKIVAESSLVATESINKAETEGNRNNGRKSKTSKIFGRCWRFITQSG